MSFYRWGRSVNRFGLAHSSGDAAAARVRILAPIVMERHAAPNGAIYQQKERQMRHVALFTEMKGLRPASPDCNL